MKKLYKLLEGQDEHGLTQGEGARMNWRWKDPGDYCQKIHGAQKYKREHGNWIKDRAGRDVCLYDGFPVSDGYFGAYSMDALALVLNAFYHGEQEDCESILAKVINRRGDADTTGAIAGQLLGAFYGLEGEPKGILPVSDSTGKKSGVFGQVWETSKEGFDRDDQLLKRCVALATQPLL